MSEEVRSMKSDIIIRTHVLSRLYANRCSTPLYFLNILPYCGIWNNQFTVGVNKPLSPIFLHNNETIFFGCPGFIIYIIELKGKTAYNALKSSSVISCKINLSVKIIKFIHSSILLQISVIPSRTTIQRLTLTYTQFFKTTHLY